MHDRYDLLKAWQEINSFAAREMELDREMIPCGAQCQKRKEVLDLSVPPRYQFRGPAFSPMPPRCNHSEMDELCGGQSRRMDMLASGRLFPGLRPTGGGWPETGCLFVLTWPKCSVRLDYEINALSISARVLRRREPEVPARVSG